MEALIAGAGALIGICCTSLVAGQLKLRKPKVNDQSDNIILSRRIDAVERVIPTLISRNEVQPAINQVPPLVMSAVQTEMQGMNSVPQSPLPPVPTAIPTPPPAQPQRLERSTLEAAQANIEKMKEMDALLKKFEDMQSTGQQP